MDERPIQKARPYQLDAHAAEIRHLIANEGWKLKKIQAHFLREYQIYASENMWKKRFRKLNLNIKNNRPDEMEKAARHYQACLDSGGPFRYEVPGHKVIDSSELLRYARRHGFIIIDGVFTKAPAEQATSRHGRQDTSNALTELQDQSVVRAEDCDGSEIAAPTACEDSMGLDPCVISPSVDASPVVSIEDGTAAPSMTFTYDEDDHSEAQEHRLVQRKSPAVVAEYSACLDRCLDPAVTLIRAQTFLAHRGYALCPSITAPDAFRYHEDLIRTIDLSVAVSFDSGDAALGDEGWLRTNKHTGAAIYRSVDMRALFQEAAHFSAQVQMRKAWRAFQTALSYLYFSMIYCLPMALWQILFAFQDLYRQGYGDMVRTIAYQASRWCKHDLKMYRFGRIFASICGIEEAYLCKVLNQALLAIYEQKKRVAGEFQEDVYPDYLFIIATELQADPQQLRNELSKLSEMSRKMDEATPNSELTCLQMIVQFSYVGGDFKLSEDIARQGLKRLEVLNVTNYWDWVSSFSRDLGLALWRTGEICSAITEMETALKAATKSETEYATNVRRDASRACSTMHQALGNLSAADKYARIADGALNVLESKVEELEPRFRGLELADDNLKEGDNSISTFSSDGPQKESEDNRAGPSSHSVETPWRPGVTSEEQNVVMSSLHYEDEESLQNM